MKNIKVVSFDLDDALYDNKPVLIEAERRCNEYLASQFAQQGIEFSTKRFYDIRHRLMHSEDPAMENMTHMRSVGLTEFCKPLENSVEVAEKALAIFLEARSMASIPKAIYQMMEKLSPKYQLVSVTNGNCDPNKLPIGQFFTKNYSPVYGFRAKPHPQMLLQVINDFAIDKNSLVHVGDSLENDGGAADKAGVEFIQFAPFISSDNLERSVKQLEEQLLN